ncbi:hypothetical protein D1BOALGB6SA_3017 [Olavius sp. associated proteobacterium Delta 1]|nr:hypothetical protein D1BOALGB6SA_3017 [Olavius sp. associated proteobacterium Delta 1]
MSISENSRNRASEKNADEAMQIQALQKSMSVIKHKFVVMSSNRGVGKTSVIVSLALSLAKKEMKVGLMDANFHGPDIHRMLGLEPVVASVSDKPFIPVAYSDELKVASIESVMQDQNGTGEWGKPPKVSDIRRFISSINWGSLDYLLVDTPPGPCAELITVLRDIPDAETIIVTAPNRISRDRAQKMINFFRKEKIPIFGWIDNMQGFLCQHCGQRQEMFSTGSAGRAIFLMDIPFLGRIPVDPHWGESGDTGEAVLETYPSSQVAEACNLIIKKILGDNKANLFVDGSTYYDL